MVVTNLVFRLLFLFVLFADLTLQRIDINAGSNNTSGTTFQGKLLSQDATWNFMKKFHANDSTEVSLVYKVSDLTNTFFDRRESPNESVEEGIIVMSGISSPFGAWEYYDAELNDQGEVLSSADVNWKEISTGNENLLRHLAVPHWHIGAVQAVDIENACQDHNHMMSLNNMTAIDCQEILNPPVSATFISGMTYIRFKRRRMFWNYFQGSESTKLIFRPACNTLFEKGLPLSPEGYIYGNPYSDFAILRAEWTDCSGEQIFTKPKWLDECGVCGGDNSSCKTCDRGKILYRGCCRNIEEISLSGNADYQLNLSSTGCSMENTSLQDAGRGKSLPFLEDFNLLQSKPFPKEMKTTKIIMGSIEIRGPDAVYAGDETLMQVQPISLPITNTQFTLKWKHHWHINGTLRKGIDWIQQGTKLIVLRNALKPFSRYNFTTFMEIENAPGIVYTASKLLTVNSKGILAVLNVTHAAESNRFLQFDASSSQDIDMPTNTFLQFAWRCQSMTTDSSCDYNLGSDLDDLKSIKEYEKESLTKRILKLDTDHMMPGRLKWSVTVFNSFSSSTVSHTIDIHSNIAINSIGNNTVENGSSDVIDVVNNSIVVKSSPLYMSNECIEEKLKTISIQLVVKPRTSTENSFGTLFSFIISFVPKMETDIAFFQKLTYSIGYVLRTNKNKNLFASGNETIFWLHTSTVLVNTTWDYLPSGENVTPVVKVCASSFQCTVTFFPIVKVTSDLLSLYNENKIREIFGNKIYNMDINGAITFMCTTFISLRHLGKEVLEGKLSPIFSNAIQRYPLTTFESSSILESYGFQKSIPWDINIVERLVKIILHLTDVDSETSRNTLFQPISKNELKNTMRPKRNSSRTDSHENDNLFPSLTAVDTTDEILKHVMSNVSKMCETVRNANMSESETKQSNASIKVLYIKDLLSHSSNDFHLKVKGADNATFALIDFGYFMKRHFAECGNNTKKKCHSVCATAVHFEEVLLQPGEHDFENSMLDVMVYHTNSSVTTMWSKNNDNFGPVLLEFNINEISINHTAECLVWDDERNEWKHICNSAIVNKDNYRILQCFCKRLGYLKILVSELPISKNPSSREQKRVEFSIINSDPELTMGKLRTIFEASLAKQLTRVLNITEVQVETWNPFPGGVVVSLRLMNTVTKSKNHQKNHPGHKSLESIVQLLDSKITNRTLLLMDLENRPLNISQSSITRRIPEEVNLVLGIIVGSVLIIGIATFSVSSFRKYHKEKLDSVRPIKHYDGIQDVDNKFENTYNGNHVSSEELGTDINYDGISCIDSSEITIRRVTSMSESQANNPKRSSAYINTNSAELNNLPHENSHSISVTHSSGDYGISTFPNMIIN